MRRRLLVAATLLMTVSNLPAQAPARKASDPQTKPFQAQSSSTINYTGGKDGDQNVEITNVAFDITGDSVPGRPRGSRLTLRTSLHSKQTVGDKGLESTVTMEAWPLGIDLKQKPLYSVSVPGIDARAIDGSLWLVDRSLDGDVNWWSLYKLGSGQHLLDTYVNLVRFTVSRADGTERYAGLEVPPDDASDTRLKESHVVAVVTLASSDKVMREALITCTDTARAQLLRSYADTMRTMTLVEGTAGRQLRVVFEDGYPSPPKITVVLIPIVKDDLDITHAQLPAGLHAIAWKR
jgi:hypothetical protein